MKENKEIVEKIRSICREKETSLTKLEESFGWSNGYIGKWAKAKKNPTIEKLSMIANELGVSVSNDNLNYNQKGRAPEMVPSLVL